jgi:hypothetical protein
MQIESKHKINRGTYTNKTYKKTQDAKWVTRNIEPSKFISTSRLNRGQRKYCHCLMQVRSANARQINQSGAPKKLTQKNNPYGICRNMSYQTMLKNRGQPAYRFKPKKTNCIMNYEYSQYSLADVQALAQERNIPIFNNKTDRPYAKSTLIQLLTSRYIKNHRMPANNRHKDNK